ncbi:MAG: SsrA-binding protein SmpB [Taibaiella sp.]|nr:SsrA-binding protein SmpB [Taibaiella sp.]
MSDTSVFIKNRPATFEYAIEDRLKAGIVLTGSEIKSVRNSKVSFNDSYCFYSKGELWIKSLHIAEYVNAGYASHDPIRERKLLLNRRELNKWQAKVKEKGLTIVPLNMYLDENGRAKMEIGLGKGKKLHDKRETTKNREVERDMKRYIK